ncbi:thermonuclease family protein [Bartonella tribocorum]|uniref:Micrococcal nuclease n=1 Tax=Bartonella tribocorum (strain DSM 28219 / CCUG 45778 / CIP 105476 / IBS 506) TaxID=382640 RepID=A9IU24_BART1|nr:thermonuclease family protein [Bartonella tribocorum]CAK01503.1 putative micrococcal nuclease [Bartonella tribocorum CIP 105476]CDO48746.1 putative nuclease [Bartonella tribocorum]
MKKFFSHFNLRSFKKNIGFSIFAAASMLIIMATYFKQTQPLPQKEKFSSQNSVEGKALIIDGDSITISSIKIRLVGIDAPELHQFCGKKDARYPCGLEAKKYLEQLLENQTVTCHWRKTDKYRRILATCQTKQVSNINATLVQNGWAVSYYEYPKEEQEARRKKRGIWASSFQRPREWRKANPRTE